MEKEFDTSDSVGVLNEAEMSQQYQRRMRELDDREARLFQREQKEIIAGKSVSISTTSQPTYAESFLSKQNPSVASFFPSQTDSASSALSGFPTGNAAAIMALFFEQQIKDERDAAATLRLKLMMNYLQQSNK